MIAVYILTILIATFWIVEIIRQKKFILRRTLLDIPLLIFLGSQVLSTIFSVDLRTSLLGYYSRFNGGLFSIICYVVLYWAFVSNMNRLKALKSIYFLLLSSLIVSVYAVLERLGIDKNLWVQDVQNRVFSTLGQPNWLASWIVAIIPVTWALSLKEKFGSKRFWIYFPLSLLLFSVLLFTKSRSGILGFIFADFIFWIYILIRYKKEFLVKSIVCNLSFALLILLVGTVWTPSLKNLITHKPTTQTAVQGPALETGGTESGVIRKIVWEGALRVWGHYPIMGSGVETFAFSYYGFRPQEHNLVSEWDFLYNKAHNEYLNFAATTGTLGLLSHLSLIFFAILLFVKKIKSGQEKINILPLSLLTGFASLLITNFFGFSTVSTQIEFFLFPAMAVSLSVLPKAKDSKKINNLDNNRKLYIFGLALISAVLVYSVLRYWHADTLFAKGKKANEGQNYTLGQGYLTKATKISPKEAMFHNELANSYTGIAL